MKLLHIISIILIGLLVLIFLIDTENFHGGVRGPKGNTGDIGPIGPTGYQGSRGISGETGEVGPEGETGDVGPMGPRGVTGETGPPGPRGLQPTTNNISKLGKLCIKNTCINETGLKMLKQYDPTYLIKKEITIQKGKQGKPLAKIKMPNNYEIGMELYINKEGSKEGEYNIFYLTRNTSSSEDVILRLDVYNQRSWYMKTVGCKNYGTRSRTYQQCKWEPAQRCRYFRGQKRCYNSAFGKCVKRIPKTYSYRYCKEWNRKKVDNPRAKQNVGKLYFSKFMQPFPIYDSWFPFDKWVKFVVQYNNGILTVKIGEEGQPERKLFMSSRNIIGNHQHTTNIYMGSPWQNVATNTKIRNFYYNPINVFHN